VILFTISVHIFYLRAFVYWINTFYHKTKMSVHCPNCNAYNAYQVDTIGFHCSKCNSMSVS
jgi:hypothetical protein